MHKWIKYSMIGTAIIMALLVGGAWYMDKSPTNNIIQAKAKSAIASEEPQTEDVIHSGHTIFNGAICYGKDAGFDFEGEWAEEMQTYKSKVEEQLPDIKDEKLQDDLKNVILLIDIGLNEKDITALIYAHRVLHDLDIVVDGYSDSKEIFAYSTFLNGEHKDSVTSLLKESHK
ncbi:hypothetical protein [Priestia megaterium]|uniref:hypothetical protein n=1 Tax=Priestia megaterium TaxID=1404 RepID=UPI003242D6DC